MTAPDPDRAREELADVIADAWEGIGTPLEVADRILATLPGLGYVKAEEQWGVDTGRQAILCADRAHADLVADAWRAETAEAALERVQALADRLDQEARHPGRHTEIRRRHAERIRAALEGGA